MDNWLTVLEPGCVLPLLFPVVFCPGISSFVIHCAIGLVCFFIRVHEMKVCTKWPFSSSPQNQTIFSTLQLFLLK